MLSLAKGRTIHIRPGYTDLRKGVDGLAWIVKNECGLDPQADALYLFCGRRADRMKGLYWDSGRGFVLIYSRLENGRYQWPRAQGETRAITADQFRRLLEGFQIEDVSTIKTVDIDELF